MIVASEFSSVQTNLHFDGINYFQRFVVPKYTSSNTAVCDISSYTPSLDPSSIIPIPDFVVDSSSSPTELYIDRLFDGALYDYDFFLHVETVGGSHSASVVTELLQLNAPCDTQDLSIALIQNQDLSYGSGYHILENFVSTDQALC